MRVFPDPILRRRARKVTRFDARLARLAADLEETMTAHGGVGLAANQVGVLQRVVVIKLQEWDEAMTLVNPEIIRREGLREVEEGCLSLPGYRGMVRRAERVRVRYQDLKGKQQRLKAECMLAQAVEHETDHLNGILYLDHLVAHDQFYRIRVDKDGEVEYLPSGEPDAAELEAAARRMNGLPPLPQFDPTSGRSSGRPAAPDAAGDVSVSNAADDEGAGDGAQGATADTSVSNAAADEDAGDGAQGAAGDVSVSNAADDEDASDGAQGAAGDASGNNAADGEDASDGAQGAAAAAD